MAFLPALESCETPAEAYHRAGLWPVPETGERAWVEGGRAFHSGLATVLLHFPGGTENALLEDLDLGRGLEP